MTQQPTSEDQRPSSLVDLHMFNVDAAMIGEQSQIANPNPTNSLDFSQQATTNSQYQPTQAIYSSEYQPIRQSVETEYGYHPSFGHYSFLQEKQEDH